MKKQTQLANEIKKLQYQLSYSQHINKQMSQQLAVLYDKTGIPPAKIRQVADINVINTQMHLQQLYYVEPLLMCYEETIYLLKNQLDELKEEGQAIFEQVQKVVKENTFLRKQLETKIEILKKSDNLGVNVNFLNLQNKDLREKIQLVNSKYEYMARKNKQLQEQLNKNIKDKLGMFGEGQIKKMQQRAKQEQKILQAKNIELSSQIDIIKNQLNNERSLVSEYQRKITQNQTDLTKLKNQLRVCKQQLDNQHAVHEGAEENLQSQLQTLKQQLKSSQRKQQEMFTKNMSMESQLQDKNNRVHNLNLQNAQMQTNNNNMLQMLESYEVKVTNLNKKIKKLEAEIKEVYEGTAQMNKKSEISEWKLAQKVEQLERKEAEWKKQRARLSQMWEQRLDSMRKSYENQMSLPTND